MSEVILGSADWNFWPITKDYSQIFGYLKELQIQSVELGIYKPSQELAPKVLRELMGKAQDANIQISAILFSLTSDLWDKGALSNSESRFRDEFQYFLTAVEINEIQCANVWTGVDPIDSNPVELRRTLDEMNLLAGKFSGTVSIEYKEDTVFKDAETTLGLLSGYPHLKILLDTGHAFALAEKPENLVEYLGKQKKLGSIHLGDAHFGKSDDDLPCGRVHNFEPLVTALKNLNQTTVVNFDLYGAASDPSGPGPISIVGESFRHLKECGL